jgi:5S rRNA maturation endonuclease (ribonuclease M5)
MDEYEKLVEEIKKLKQKNILVVVEGRRDKAALEAFGIKKVETLNKHPLYNIVEKISENHKSIALLVDLDKEGKKLFGKLNHGFAQHGVKVDNKFREFLFKKTKLRQIEGLRRYVEHLKEKH